MLLNNGLNYVTPWGVGYIWDHVFPKLKNPESFWTLAKWCGFLILVAMARAGFCFLMIYCYWSTGVKVVRDLRNLLYEKLQRLPFRFYDTARTGDLMSRLTLDIEMVRNYYAYMFEHRSQIYLYLVMISSLLLITDWKLALVCLAVTPVFVLTVLNFSGKMRGAVVDRQIQAGILNAMVQENITGIRVVKAFAMEDAEIAKFSHENRRMFDKNLEVLKLQTALQPFLIFCSALGVVAVLGYGGYRVVHGDMTLGKFITFMSYLAMTNWPLMMLAPNTNQLRQAEGSVRRLLEIIDQPEEIASPPDAKILSDLQGRLEFRNVTFGYGEVGSDHWQPILKDVNWTVDAGEKVAIIGLTGSGKTSLVNMIPRFYDPQAGTITVDGIDLKMLDLQWWRRQIGLVLQETFLFSATIYDNIAFGKPEAGMAEVKKAAQAAQIDDFIVSLADQYEIVVGERGVGLSGGQKQRVAIARALLLNPRILILDDSTSSVDMETEQAIQKSLQQLMAGRTTILITQRLSTARLADRIIVLESGEIRAQGNHDQLLDQDEFYRELYNIQTFQGEQVEESV
jgi:ABC-type multidrug transport system fused ATPase/permease subunit